MLQKWHRVVGTLKKNLGDKILEDGIHLALDVPEHIVTPYGLGPTWDLSHLCHHVMSCRLRISMIITCIILPFMSSETFGTSELAMQLDRSRQVAQCVPATLRRSWWPLENQRHGRIERIDDATRDAEPKAAQIQRKWNHEAKTHVQCQMSLSVETFSTVEGTQGPVMPKHWTFACHNYPKLSYICHHLSLVNVKH